MWKIRRSHWAILSVGDRVNGKWRHFQAVQCWKKGKPTIRFHVERDTLRG